MKTRKKQQLAVPTHLFLPLLFQRQQSLKWGSVPTRLLSPPNVGGDQQAISCALKGVHPSSTSEMRAVRVLLLDGFKNRVQKLRPITVPQILKKF